MRLKAGYEKQEQIPSELTDFYVEKDGKWVLDVEGMKTDKDVATVQEALRKERADHKKTKDNLATWTVLGEDVAAVQEQLDRIPGLEAGAGGDNKDTQAKIDAAVATKLATEKTKTDRALAAEKKRADDALAENGQLKQAEKSRKISDAVRTAASTSKVIDHAMEDVLMYGDRLFDIDEEGKIVTRDNVGVTPGIAPDVWLAEQQDKKPHWWPASEGGGAKGGRGGEGVNLGSNPWSAKNWNVTAQGNYIKEKGREKADQMAKAAGSYVGATKPKAVAAS